jgi:hypothetical protein
MKPQKKVTSERAAFPFSAASISKPHQKLANPGILTHIEEKGQQTMIQRLLSIETRGYLICTRGRSTRV